MKRPGSLTKVALALSVSLSALGAGSASFAQATDSYSSLGNFGRSQQRYDWMNVPAYLDVNSRITDTDTKIVRYSAEGRLGRDQVSDLKDRLEKIREEYKTFTANGAKPSMWQRTRVILELDKLNQDIQLRTTSRIAASTDNTGRRERIENDITEALYSGRITNSEAAAYRSRLEATKSRERTLRADGVFSQEDQLTLSYELDQIRSMLDRSLRTRVISDPKIDKMQADLETRINTLLSSGKITAETAAQIRFEANQVSNKEIRYREDDGELTTEEIVDLAFNLEALNKKLDVYAPVAVSPEEQVIDDKQVEIKRLISQNRLSAKISVQQAEAFTKDYNAIEALEAVYKANNLLSNTEVQSLNQDLDALRDRINKTIAQSAPIPAFSARKASLKAKIRESIENRRLKPGVHSEDLLDELARIDAKEQFYLSDGNMDETEVLIIARDLDSLTRTLEGALQALPSLGERKAKLEAKINAALAAKRLTLAQTDEFKREIARIAGLEAAFRADNIMRDEEVLAVSDEYETLENKLARTLPPLPDIDQMQVEIKKKFEDGKNSGKISAADAAPMTIELERIDSVEKVFRASDNSLSDWEVVSLKSDLDKLSADIDRLVKVSSQPTVTVNISNLPSDSRNHWAQQYIGLLLEKGTIGGFPDGTFKPDDGITRAQFAAIVVKALGLPPAGRNAEFKDLSDKHWAYKAISSAVEGGLVGGFPDGSFRPEDKLTRTQALVILAKALQGGSAAPRLLDRYRDGQQVPAWAIPAVAKAAQAGILVNYPDSFAIRANDLATRAEVAALTYQTMANLGQSLPSISTGLEAKVNN